MENNPRYFLNVCQSNNMQQNYVYNTVTTTTGTYPYQQVTQPQQQYPTCTMAYMPAMMTSQYSEAGSSYSARSQPTPQMDYGAYPMTTTAAAVTSSQMDAYAYRSMRYSSSSFSSMGSSFSSLGSSMEEDDVTARALLAGEEGLRPADVMARRLSGSQLSKQQNFRSTKGASKQRRDLINHEISNLRDLLPLSEAARQRLSQLQVMSLACVFLRKSNYFGKLFGQQNIPSEDVSLEFTQSLNGFVLVATRDGKLLYISENVTEFLGHSMVDMMTQGDSVYDIVDKRDHPEMQTQLAAQAQSEKEQSFFVRMTMSRSLRRQTGFGDQKVLHVRGHFIQTGATEPFANQQVFFALCCPLLTPELKETSVVSPDTFQSVHSLDMNYLELPSTGEFHLGYNAQELSTMSWYSLIHPEDLCEAKEKHAQLVKATHEMGCVTILRLQAKSGDFLWFYIVLTIRQQLGAADPTILCVNHRVAAEDVSLYKQQLQLHAAQLTRSAEFLTHAQTGEGDATAGYQATGVQYQAQFTTAVTSSQQQASPFYSASGVQSFKTKLGNDLSSVAGNGLTKDTLNRLKRKVSCGEARDLKRFRNNSGSNSEAGSDCGDVTMNTFTSLESSGGGMQTLDITDLSDISVLYNTPVFYSLNNQPIKTESAESISIIEPIRGPTTPLTPDSMRSASPQSPTMYTKEKSVGLLSSQPISAGHVMQQLHVTVPQDHAVVPSSMLTPDATPTSSPKALTAGDAPSLYGLEQKIKAAMLSAKQLPLVKRQKSLPQLDLEAIDEYFSGLEDKVKVEPVVYNSVALPGNPMLGGQHQAAQAMVTNLADSLLDLVQSGGAATEGAAVTADFMLVPDVPMSSPHSPDSSASSCSSGDDVIAGSDDVTMSTNGGDFLPLFDDFNQLLGDNSLMQPTGDLFDQTL